MEFRVARAYSSDVFKCTFRSGGCFRPPLCDMRFQSLEDWTVNFLFIIHSYSLPAFCVQNPNAINITPVSNPKFIVHRAANEDRKQLRLQIYFQQIWLRSINRLSKNQLTKNIILREYYSTEFCIQKEQNKIGTDIQPIFPEYFNVDNM